MKQSRKNFVQTITATKRNSAENKNKLIHPTPRPFRCYNSLHKSAETNTLFAAIKTTENNTPTAENNSIQPLHTRSNITNKKTI